MREALGPCEGGLSDGAGSGSGGGPAARQAFQNGVNTL